MNHKVETPYIEAVLKEWQMYLDLFGTRPRIAELHLGGGTPTFFSAANLKKLLLGIFEKSEITGETDMSFEAHPANTTEDHLKTLYNLGFRRLSFGIQDFDDKVQEAINRYQSMEEVKTVVDLARSTGYESINFDLVYGLPFQNLYSLTDTVEKVMQLRPDRIAFYSYAHVPWIKPGQRKYSEKDLPADEEKRALYENGKYIFQQNGYQEIGLDHFSLPHDKLFRAAEQKSLHRNFMGYTDKHTRLLVGLGVSSISDTWDAFAQNIKTVEEYQNRVNEGHLPVTRGHVLSMDDLILRQVILNIMCNLELSWNEKLLSHPTFSSALQKLREMKQDGLVEMHEWFFKVTEQGKPFLRNICACFDEHFQAQSESRFSKAI